jgi:hypothetical protein
MHYMVEGGIYTDDTFKIVEEGKEEFYGPFDTYDEAYTAWRRNTFTQLLDNCYHRLYITNMYKVTKPQGAEILRRRTRPDND